MKKKLVHKRPMIEVRHSPIHGYGVFALRRIRKGTAVVEYLGERISHEEADARYAEKGSRDNHTFLFTVDSSTVIDAGVDGNEARYINHALRSELRKRPRGAADLRRGHPYHSAGRGIGL